MVFKVNIDLSDDKKQKQEARQLALATSKAKLRDMGYDVDESGNPVPIAGGAADNLALSQQLLNKQLQQIQGQLTATRTDSAIQEYSQTGDASALSRVLRNDAFAKDIWAQQGVMDIGNIDLENDKQLLERGGITPDMLDTEEERLNFKKNFYKVFDGNKWDIGSINNLAAQTGYMRRASKDAIETLNNNRAALRASMEGKLLSQTQQQLDISERQVENKEKELAQDARQFDIKTELDRGEQALKSRELDIREAGGFGTTKMKESAGAAQKTEDLYEAFGGEQEFYKTDFSKPENKRKAYEYISTIEKLEGTELSEPDKKTLTQINELITLADPTQKLTQKETGIIDNFLGGVRTYITDNVDGVEAKSSYSTFRNTLRNALFGATLTAPEIKSFNEAFGSLGQQRGPVLEKFLTSLNQLQAKLDTLSSFSNPAVAQVRMGVSQERLERIRSNMRTLIDASQGKPVDTNEVKPRPSLDEIFGGL